MIRLIKSRTNFNFLQLIASCAQLISKFFFKLCCFCLTLSIKNLAENHYQIYKNMYIFNTIQNF